MSSLSSLVFVPKPRSVLARQGTHVLPSSGVVLCNGDPQLLFPIARTLQEVLLGTQNLRWTMKAGSAKYHPESGIVITLQPESSIPAQGYHLQVLKSRIEITASEPRGAFYAVMTLKQILRQTTGNAIPCCLIKDHPDFESRGIMLDVCRDKVPKLETLFALVDEFAEMKTNHLELYMEHTFAYRNHPPVWAQASPLTGEDIMRLDHYCRERFIELVPNQNSFGHMHRWFDIPKYLPLAECQEGFVGPGNHRWGPFSLAPEDPKSIQLIDDLYTDLLPNFSSSKFNVGCDETFDLGMGKTKQSCEKKGKGRVYLDFLLKINKLVKSHGKTMHFWGDIILHHPELIPELPKDIVVLDWGYGANHPYDKECPLFRKSGIPFYVCPGTSTWGAIAGVTRNCLANLKNAAEHGLKNGAIGYLNTDWGDSGHWQYIPASYLGFAAGAAYCWCFKTNEDADIVRILDTHVFKDSEGIMGKLAYELGDVHVDGDQLLNNRTLFFNLQGSFNSELMAGFTKKQIDSASKQIQRAVKPLRLARMNRPDAELVSCEYENAARMLEHACKRALTIKSGPPTKKALSNLADELRSILGEHCRLWTERNQVGGLRHSVTPLERQLASYNS